MIDHKHLRTTVVRGLREYLGVHFIISNQAEEQPAYPFGSYTVTTLKSENNGTWGEYADGKARNPVTQTWSITFASDDESESIMLADKAHNWLQYLGAPYLNDNGVIVQKVTNVTNRDNVLSVGYEYKNGFDCVFWLLDESGSYYDGVEEIETVQIGDIAVSNSTVY